MEYRERVAKLFDSLSEIPESSAEIEYLQHRLSVTRQDIIDAWLFYDLGIMNYSNESYSSKNLRVAMHLHNGLPGNWHDHRQGIVLKYLEGISPATICDIGFGTPQRYVRSFLLNRQAKITLCEYEPSSLEFAAAVLEHWDPSWASTVRLAEHDMNRDDLPVGGALRKLICT